MNTNAKNNGTTVATTKTATIKKQVQNGAVVAVQCATYPAVLLLQTTADLINIGQAGLINAIDGTPVLESMNECASWTQTQQAYVVNAGLKLKEKYQKQREANRKRDIEKTKKILDELEGVEQVQPKIVAKISTEPIAPKTEASAVSTEPTAPPVVSAPVVPAPPVVSAPVVPAPASTTRKPRTSVSANKPLPSMTAGEAFQG